MINLLKSFTRKLLSIDYITNTLHSKNEILIKRELESVKLLVAKNILCNMHSHESLSSIHEAEFSVFSQFGEDGIIQYLIRRCNLTPDEQIFVEFGVQDYSESNTRFLLLNNNWKGLVIDQSSQNIKSIQSSEISWRNDLRAVASFITRENINDILNNAGIKGKIGLLSIDIDGNDYWVWENITVIDPVIVVIEYNSLFGSQKSVVVPYEKNFERAKAHYSCLYWGASIKALTRLAALKGYALVGSNSAGNNLFFVKKDRLNNLTEFDAGNAYVKSKYRDSRSRTGELSFLDSDQQQEAIRECPVFDFDRQQMVLLSDIFISS